MERSIHEENCRQVRQQTLNDWYIIYGNSYVNSICRESLNNMESISLLAAVREMSLRFSLEQTKEDIRDRSLFITWGGGGSVVTENPKGRIAENFGRIRRGDHSNLLGK